MSASKTFNYFAYGSNLLTDRIRVRNKSAAKKSIGTLRSYKLTFSTYSGFWKGGTANIVPAGPESHVLGIVWALDESDSTNLDAQEAGYSAIEVDVEASEGLIKCRTYVQHPSDSASDGSSGFLMPSLAYKTVIVKGAEEHGMDPAYIEKIKQFPDNGILECSLPQVVEKLVKSE